MRKASVRDRSANLLFLSLTLTLNRQEILPVLGDSSTRWSAVGVSVSVSDRFMCPGRVVCGKVRGACVLRAGIILGLGLIKCVSALYYFSDPGLSPNLAAAARPWIYIQITARLRVGWGG